MSKFKVGDKVRILKTDYSGYRVGDVVEVVRTEDHAIIGLKRARDGAVLNFFDHEVEAVAPQKGTRQRLVIEALTEGGYLVSAPYEHNTRLAAFTKLPEAVEFIERNMK